MHGTDNVPIESDGISRSLFLEMDLTPWSHGWIFFTQRKAREAQNLNTLKKVLVDFDPDLVFIWGMWNLSRRLPALLEQRLPGRVIYRFAEYWPTLPSQHELYWRRAGRKWYSKPPKWLLRNIARFLLAREQAPPLLRFEHAICVSAATRDLLVQAGLPLRSARIIHTGLDIEPFVRSRPADASVAGEATLRLLFAGRLTPDKGLETALYAMAKLISIKQTGNIHLHVAGAGEMSYQHQLHGLVSQLGLDSHVTFLGRIPADEMPALYAVSDVMVLPSTWPEPFARVVLEAMISGLVVVASEIGGTPELIKDGENGLLFDPNDSDALAQKIAGLITDPMTRKRLSEAGRKTVYEKFTFSKMLDQIEQYLLEVANRAPKIEIHRSPKAAGVNH